MIDAHCHLQDDSFVADFDIILAEAGQRGVRSFVVNGTSEADWEKVATLAREHEQIVPSFGLHPWFVQDRSPEWFETLAGLLDEFPEAGVGEIGLDRWIKDYDMETQLPVFEKQWRLAVERNRPITVHCLKAWGQLEQSLKELPESRFLLHSYSGSREMVPVFAEMGAFFSISGYFLKPEKTAKLEVFDEVPDDRLLLETDCPEMELPEDLDLYPQCEFNHPANLSVVYEKVAVRKGLSVEELEEKVNRNLATWFRSAKLPLQG